MQSCSVLLEETLSADAENLKLVQNFLSGDSAESGDSVDSGAYCNSGESCDSGGSGESVDSGAQHRGKLNLQSTVTHCPKQ